MTRKPSGCPYCSRPTKQTSVTNSLEMTHEYLIPEIDINKNQYLARDLTAGSTAHGITWTCLEESHDFCLNVASRIKRLTPCPECSQEKATVGYNLTTEHPHLVSQIDPFRNGIGFDPTTVHPNSETMIWWRCPTGPDHVWKQSPYVRGTKGTGCPYCPSKQGSTRFASCTFSLESTKALENLKYTWSEDNGKLTREVPTKSDYRAIVYCEKGHERRTAVYNITGDQASGCGACKLQGRSKIEVQIEFELATIFQSINTTIYSKHREIRLIGQKRNMI